MYCKEKVPQTIPEAAAHVRETVNPPPPIPQTPPPETIDAASSGERPLDIASHSFQDLTVAEIKHVWSLFTHDGAILRALMSEAQSAQFGFQLVGTMVGAGTGASMGVILSLAVASNPEQFVITIYFFSFFTQELQIDST